MPFLARVGSRRDPFGHGHAETHRLLDGGCRVRADEAAMLFSSGFAANIGGDAALWHGGWPCSL